jgi:hypothetical protein
MKKFAIGCLIVLGLAAVAGGIGLYLAYDRLFKPGLEMAASFKELGTLSDIEKQVRNTATFEVPQGEALTQAMVDRFVKVQQRIQSALGPQMTELKAKSEALDKAVNGERRRASVRELATGLKDLTGIVIAGKRAQVEALNDAGFSVREYEWVRQQVYAAVGVVAVGFDIKKIAEDAKAGDVEAMSKRERDRVPDVPEGNKALVAPFEKQIKEWAPLAFFGL